MLTHTHIHKYKNANGHAHLAQPGYCEPCKQSSWSWARNSQKNRPFLTASGVGTWSPTWIIAVAWEKALNCTPANARSPITAGWAGGGGRWKITGLTSGPEPRTQPLKPHTHTQTHTHTKTNTHTHTHAHKDKHTRTNACTHTSMHTQTHIHKHAHTNTCTHTHWHLAPANNQNHVTWTLCTY